MGKVISFPASERDRRKPIGGRIGSAIVIILPVIRIERIADEPAGRFQPQASGSLRRRRRRRATRS
jgi:hypothetical protein